LACRAPDNEIALNGNGPGFPGTTLAAGFSIRKRIEWDWPDARREGRNPPTPQSGLALININNKYKVIEPMAKDAPYVSRIVTSAFGLPRDDGLTGGRNSQAPPSFREKIGLASL
jgi:hypothetical protein